MKSTYEDRIKNERENKLAREKALILAQQRMEREGIRYPLFTSMTCPTEHYDEIRRYSEIETTYMLEFLNMPSGPRPVIEYKKEEWKPYYEEK